MDNYMTVEWINGEYGPYMKISKGSRWLNVSNTSWTKIMDSKVILWCEYFIIYVCHSCADNY